MHITKLALQLLSNYIFTIMITSSIFIIIIIIIIILFYFLGVGVNFCHLTTKKKSNATHTKDFCEKKNCKTKLPYFKAMFSEIAIFGNHCFLDHVLPEPKNSVTN